MFKTAHEQNINFDRAELEKIWSFGKDIEIEKDETRTRSMDASVGVGGIGAALGSLFDISGRIGSESATRNAVREKVQYHISDLLAGIKMLAESIEKATEKPWCVWWKTWTKPTSKLPAPFFTTTANRLLHQR
jgi:hypothetical protein